MIRVALIDAKLKRGNKNWFKKNWNWTSIHYNQTMLGEQTIINYTKAGRYWGYIHAQKIKIAKKSLPTNTLHLNPLHVELWLLDKIFSQSVLCAGKIFTVKLFVRKPESHWWRQCTLCSDFWKKRRNICARDFFSRPISTFELAFFKPKSIYHLKINKIKSSK